ncbi:MAG TPA: A/G-specific adenine glycosylase [Bacteroidia bacterium]|nr:A/G-specific adenine glycosylase [Bacteroidia bacterium]
MDFSTILIKWYNINKRDLPFRRTRDPYKIWLSEIILQQTRVSQGLPYYEKFVELFPTIHHLAKAKEDVVMKAWQGLGYYSRARNLHSTAQHISKVLKGKFPETFEGIKQLKGIGDYTAGAIVSLAFNKPYVVVDGNVFRVLSRYFGIRTPIDSHKGKSEYKEKAESLLDRDKPGDFNQAVMEFGALQCVPVNPDCTICPLKNSCVAYSNDIIHILPVKSKKVKTRIRHFNYLVFRNKGKVLLKKRTEKDIWKNLYDFPLIETEQEINQILQYVKKNTSIKLMSNTEVSVSKMYKHILSHQIIYARFWKLNSFDDKKYISKNKIIHVDEKQLDKYAFPRLIEQYFQEKPV